MKRIVFLLLVVVVLAGCKSSKHLATSEKNVQVSSYLTSKLQLTIPGKKGGSMSVGGTMKMCAIGRPDEQTFCPCHQR